MKNMKKGKEFEQTVHQKGFKYENKHIERYSTLLAIRKML